MNKKIENFKEVYKILKPPAKWRFTVIVFLGIIAGLGLHIFYISNAVSYISDDPKACINCHVMFPQYATWERGSHGRFANCNDCHVPHNNVVNKYLFKAQDGLRHAFMFTFRQEPQVIRIKQAGKDAVQQNCLRCHSNSIHPTALRAISANSIIDEGDRYCWDCHRETPHGRVNSLASTPNATVPRNELKMSNWIRDFIKSE